MRYLILAVMFVGSATLTGCFNDNNSFDSRDNVNDDVAADQAKAKSAVSRTDAVIGASNNLNNDEPQDIDRIMLPEANIAEPVAINGANASL